MTHTFLTTTLLSTLLCLASCGGSTESLTTETAAPAGEVTTTPALPDRVVLSPEQQKASELALGSIEIRSLSARVAANGQVELPPQNQASVSALFAGVVRSILVKEGELVQAGKVLATIENPDLIKLQEEYLTTLNQLKFAGQELDRQQTLHEEEIGTRRKYEQAQSDVHIQKARLAALAKHLTTLGISPKQVEAGKITSLLSVSAPIKGYVRVIGVTIGTYAQPGLEMFELVNNDHLHLQLQVFEKDFSKMAEGQLVLFSLPNVAAEPMEAKVFSLGKAFEGDSRMVTVHAELEQEKNNSILPGMYVTGQILAGKQEVASLPDEALVRYNNKHFIFVAESPNTFKMEEVTPGITENGFTEVAILNQEAVTANKVVVKGAYYLLADKMKAEVAE